MSVYRYGNKLIHLRNVLNLEKVNAIFTKSSYIYFNMNKPKNVIFPDLPVKIKFSSEKEALYELEKIKRSLELLNDK